MGDIQFNGTPEEWDALVKKNKKKETLEEAADRLFKTHSNNTSLAEGHYDYMMDKEDFKEASLEIAKWQQERMFELVKEYNQMLIDSNVHEDHKEKSFKEWFEQFKKK